MADVKKSKDKPKAKQVKEMSKKDCKDVKGGLKVSGGLAGPEDFNFSNP